MKGAVDNGSAVTWRAPGGVLLTPCGVRIISAGPLLAQRVGYGLVPTPGERAPQPPPGVGRLYLPPGRIVEALRPQRLPSDALSVIGIAGLP